MNESKLRFKDDDGSEFPDWEEKSVGDITIELKEYEQLNSGYPLMTSSRIGLMMQEDFRSKSSTEDDTAIFSVVPRGVATYRHMSDDNIFHFNINNLVDKGLVSKEYPVFNTVNGHSLYLLVEYLNSSKKFLNFCKAQKKGGTRTRLYFKVLKEFKFNMPSLPEQQKIADFLSTIDTVIEKQKTTVEAWEERKKGVVQKLFSQEVRFKADDGSEFPDWEEKKVANLFSKIKEKNKDGKIQNVITNSAEFGLINQRDFFDKDIAVDGKTENYTIIKTGDFVYNPRKSKQAPYGPFNCYRLKEDGIVSPLYTCLRPKGIANAEYLLWYFQSGAWYRFIYENGAQNGARHDRVGMTDSLMQDIPVYVPRSLEEQQKIADCLSSLDDVIEKQKATLVAWKEMKKGLLQQMFV